MQAKFESLEKFIQLSKEDSRKFVGGIISPDDGTSKLGHTTCSRTTSWPGHPSTADSQTDEFVYPD